MGRMQAIADSADWLIQRRGIVVLAVLVLVADLFIDKLQYAEPRRRVPPVPIKVPVVSYWLLLNPWADALSETGVCMHACCMRFLLSYFVAVILIITGWDMGVKTLAQYCQATTTTTSMMSLWRSPLLYSLSPFS
jgi:hypothetical protein